MADILLTRGVLHLTLSGKATLVSLRGELVLCRPELTSSSSRLLEMLLLLSVGKSDLNRVLLSIRVETVVAKVLDDVLTNVARLEACKTDATTHAALVAKDASRAHLVWREDGCKLVLVHALGQVRDVEVGVVIIGDCFELRVE